MGPAPRVKSFHRPFEENRPNGGSGGRSSTVPNASSSPHRARILIGPNQASFKVNRDRLCSVSPFFRKQLQQQQQQQHHHHHHQQLEDPPSRVKPSKPSKPAVSLWLPGESVSMFSLFAEWLHHEARFRWFLDDAVSTALEAGQQAAQDLHWAMIRLHLFASHLDIHPLQDTAMDALQDLYLKCDWDVSAELVRYLYTRCEALPAVRLRRWAVAMVAFSLCGASLPTSTSLMHPRSSAPHSQAIPENMSDSTAQPFRDLLRALPEFATDYDRHNDKMAASGLDARFKNPQLRIPANKLLNDERAFGFRECSFHSHRATIGERRCPYGVGRADSSNGAGGAGGGLARLSDMTVTHGGRELQLVPPRPHFARGGGGGQGEMALKHIRSVSSTLK